VPWANEPGCGSCHTGDAGSNLAGTTGTLVNTVDTNGNTDGIRLRQAWNTGDAKATPIVPTNKRFAEPAVPASYNGFANPGAGNPRLYRVSTGHGGVMCEGCHGATHAEWPNANSNANDNVTATQLQGHTGTIVECGTCHGSAMNSQITLGAPHGMHPVGITRASPTGATKTSTPAAARCATASVPVPVTRARCSRSPRPTATCAARWCARANPWAVPSATAAAGLTISFWRALRRCLQGSHQGRRAGPLFDDSLRNKHTER
jgi:hypothetical protein